MRPPFVTTAPSRSAVPAWKTSAPVASAASIPVIGEPRSPARRIVAGREHDGHRRARCPTELDVAEIAGRSGSERGEQVTVDERQQRLRLGIAEAAVVLEHTRARRA